MSSTMNLSFGMLLKRHRRAARLTQGELAEQAGYSTSYISMLERGERLAQPSAVEILAETLGLDTADRAAFIAANRRQAAALADSAALAQVTPTPPVAAAPSVVAPADAATLAPSDQPSVAGAAIHTFLIADVRGYTRYTLEHGDEEAARLAARFATLVRATIGHYDGQLLELRGDEALVVFTSSRQALRAAVALQARFVAQTPTPLAVGIGLDAGEAVPVADGGYRGAALNLAARLCSLAGPGEVLASEGVIHLARVLPELHYTERGQVQLKGFADLVRVIHITPASDDSVDERHRAAEVPTPSTPAGHAVSPAPQVASLPVGGFLGALPEGPLVARTLELGQLVAALEQAAGGAGRLVLLAGEPGVGKTRLAQEVTREARNRGMLVATGRCYAGQQAVPYYPFLEPLAALVTAAPPAMRADIMPRLPDLARLLPALSGAIASPALAMAPHAGPEQQQRLFWQVASFVQALAQAQPIALLLDDLHWADTASLDLLQHLARHTRGTRVLLLGTYRDTEVARTPLLQAALAALAHEHLAERVAVRRFALADTAALMAAALGSDTDTISAELAALVHTPTEGNALFVQEVVRDLMERGELTWTAEHWERRSRDEVRVPESVQMALDERISRLGAAAQEILHTASVLGQMFSFDDLWHTDGRDEEVVEAALGEATASGLVRAGEREIYYFNHVLTQRALYQDLSTRRRRRLHAAAGTAIEQVPERLRTARVAELAGHWLAADEPARAVPYVLAAGDAAAAVYAGAEAERHYRKAVEVARALSDAQCEGEALEKLGVLLDLRGQMDEARRTLEQSVETYRAAGEIEGQRRSLSRLARVLRAGNLPEERLIELLPLLEALRDGAPSPGLAVLYLGLSRLYTSTRRLHEGLAAIERSAEIAEAVGYHALIPEVAAIRSGVLAAVGRSRESLEVAERAIPLAEALGDSWWLTGLLGQVAGYYFNHGDFAQSLRFAERSVAVAERIGDPGPTAGSLGFRGLLEYYLGDWDAMRRDYERSAAHVPPLGTHFLSIGSALGQGHLCLLKAERAEAARYFEAALAEARKGTHADDALEATARLAELDLTAGNPQMARARLEPLLTDADGQEVEMPFVHRLLAWSYLDLGDTAMAARMVTRGIALAKDQEDQVELAEALPIRAMVELRQGQPQQCAATLEEALALCRSMPYPYAEAKALYIYGQLYIAQDEPERARECYEAALAILTRLGERLYAEHIERALAELPG